MLAFACNRAHCGLQLENAITFLSCGVSEKVNDYLHFLGLTSSRKTALSSLETLKRETKRKIKEMGSRSGKCHPLWCLDNIDIEARVHDKNVDSYSRMFHGTWGYLHDVPEHLLEDVSEEDINLKAYLDAVKKSQEVPVELDSFYLLAKRNPTSKRLKSHRSPLHSWKTVLKRGVQNMIIVRRIYQQRSQR